MDPNTPVTKEEALQYDKDAIEANIAKLKLNIKNMKEIVPEAEISKMEAEVNRLYQIKAIIDTNE